MGTKKTKDLSEQVTDVTDVDKKKKLTSRTSKNFKAVSSPDADVVSEMQKVKRAAKSSVNEVATDDLDVVTGKPNEPKLAKVTKAKNANATTDVPVRKSRSATKKTDPKMTVKKNKASTEKNLDVTEETTGKTRVAKTRKTASDATGRTKVGNKKSSVTKKGTVKRVTKKSVAELSAIDAEIETEKSILDESVIATVNPKDVWQHYHKNVQPDFGMPPPPEPPSIPDSYGDDRVILLARDPEWLYCYWDCSAENWNRLLPYGHLPAGKRLVLRLFKVDFAKWPDMVYQYWMDVPISEHSRDWYIRVPEQGCIWRAELGLVDSESKYENVIDSNIMPMPGIEISNDVAVNWLTVDDVQFEQLAGNKAPADFSVNIASYLPEDVKSISQNYASPETKRISHDLLVKASHVEQVRVLRGSEEIIYHIKKTIENMGLHKHVSSFSLAEKSINLAAGRLADSDFFEINEDGSFPLDVVCELTLNGKTDPKALITVNGNPLKVEYDGCFTVSYSLSPSDLYLDVVGRRLDLEVARAIELAVTLREKKKTHSEN